MSAIGTAVRPLCRWSNDFWNSVQRTRWSLIWRRGCWREVSDASLSLPDAATAIRVLNSLTGLEATDATAFEHANDLLREALDMWDGDRKLLQHLRKAASRLDELLYGPSVA